MSVEWLTAPPQPVLDDVEAAVRDGSGAVLIGPIGVGKTTLARMAAERLAPTFGPVGWLVATAADGAVPFAACSSVFRLSDTGRTADVLRAARAALGDGRLLIVDDAQFLDWLSAALIYQLAVSRAARLIITVDTDYPAPEAVSALWRDGLLARIEAAPDAHDADQLSAQINRYVNGLSPDAHRALQYLTVAGGLPRDRLAALAGAAAVEQALDAGAVTLDGDVARPFHPLYCEAVRAGLTEPDLRRLRTALAGTGPPADAVGRLRWAGLALDSDAPAPTTELVAAAETALRLGDLGLGERLGRAAVGQAGVDQAGAGELGLAARLPLAYALAFQGRGRDADAVLAEVDPAGLSQTELMAWALPRAANQFWMLSQPERAMAFLQATRQRVVAPAARTTLDALSATFAMNAGRPQQALQIATAVLASPVAEDTAVGWAGAAAALSAARMGRIAEVDGLAERAMAAGHPGLLRFTSGFGQTTALLLAGELDRAQTLAQELTDVAQLQQPGRAIGELLIADVLLTGGDFDDAVPLLRAAVTALAPTGYSWGPLASMLLARALAGQGSAAEAAIALSRAESRHGLKSMLFAPELGLARAWTLAARGDGHGAVAAARAAARAADRGGQSAIALRAYHDAVRLGDIRAVDGITRLQVDCPLGRLALQHAQALTAGNAAGLDEVAAAFHAVGMAAAAADAAAQAARLRG